MARRKLLNTDCWFVVFESGEVLEVKPKYDAFDAIFRTCSNESKTRRVSNIVRIFQYRYTGAR